MECRGIVDITRVLASRGSGCVAIDVFKEGQSRNSSLMEVTDLGMVVFMQPAINVLVAVSIMALQLLRESYFGLSLATEMAARLEQPYNALSPMEVTELGMWMLVRPEQPENASSPMEVTELGIVVFLQPAINVLVAVSIMALQLLRESYFGLSLATEMVARLEQPRNAQPPMVVTELGMLMSVRLEQPENAPMPMEVTEFGIVVFLQPAINVLVAVSIMALQLLRESYFVLLLATEMFSRLEQHENAEFSM